MFEFQRKTQLDFTNICSYAQKNDNKMYTGFINKHALFCIVCLAVDKYAKAPNTIAFQAFPAAPQTAVSRTAPAAPKTATLWTAPQRQRLPRFGPLPLTARAAVLAA